MKFVKNSIPYVVYINKTYTIYGMSNKIKKLFYRFDEKIIVGGSIMQYLEYRSCWKGG